MAGALVGPERTDFTPPGADRPATRRLGAKASTTAAIVPGRRPLLGRRVVPGDVVRDCRRARKGRPADSTSRTLQPHRQVQHSTDLFELALQRRAVNSGGYPQFEDQFERPAIVAPRPVQIDDVD